MQSRDDDLTRHLDVGYLGQFLGQTFERAVYARLDRSGFSKVRGVHGYVVQRLIEGPRGVSAIARDLEVTQQAVSKWVVELSELGLIEPAKSDDARERKVQLTKRGRACIRAAREARDAVTRKLELALGVPAIARLKTELRAALEETGGFAAVRARRVKPVR